MSDIVVTLPNGRGEATFPAGTPEKEIKAAIDKLLVPSLSDGLARSFASGALLNFGDEAAAAVRAALPGLSDWMMKPSAAQEAGAFGREPVKGQTVSTATTYEGRYGEELAKERQGAKDFKTVHPNLDTAANITGTLAGTGALAFIPGVGPIVLGGGGTTVPGMMARGAASGAVLGGAAGYGEGEGEDDRKKKGVTGAAIGGAVGGLVPPILAGGKILYDKVAPKALPKIADLIDLIAPKAKSVSLSAAAPEGGQPIVQAGIMADTADMVRNLNTRGQTRAAVDRIATEVERSGGVDRARARLTELGPDAMLADTGEATQRLANIGFILPGEAPDKYRTAFTARNERAPDRFIDSLGPAKNAPTMSEAQRDLVPYISAEGRRIYDPVLRGDNKLRLSSEMQELLDVPAIKSALQQVQNDAIETGAKLTPLEQAHRIKQTLNRMADAAFQSGKPVNKADVGNLATRWEQAFWAANPKVKDADAAYATIVGLDKDWLQRGRSILKEGQGEAAVDVSPTALAADLPGATPKQRETFEIGSTNALRESALKGPKATRRLSDTIQESRLLKQKLTEIYGPERADQIIRQAQTELTYGGTQNRVMGGSPTAQRGASIIDDVSLTVPPVGGDFSAALNWLRTTGRKIAAPNEATRSTIADMLANPNQSQNFETLMLINEILTRRAGARPFSAGAAAATGGQSPGMPGQ